MEQRQPDAAVLARCSYKDGMRVSGWAQANGSLMVELAHHQGLGAVGATGSASHSVPPGALHSSCRAAAPRDGGQYCRRGAAQQGNRE